MMRIISVVQTNRVPDWLLRLAIRTGLKLNNRRRYRVGIEARHAEKRALIDFGPRLWVGFPLFVDR